MIQPTGATYQSAQSGGRSTRFIVIKNWPRRRLNCNSKNRRDDGATASSPEDSRVIRKILPPGSIIFWTYAPKREYYARDGNTRSNQQQRSRKPMIYAHTYQPGPMFKTESGEWKPIKVLSLQTVKTHGVELTELATPEEAMALIEKSGVQMVNFGLFGLPRHPVEITHKKLGQFVRKLFKAKIARD